MNEVSCRLFSVLRDVEQRYGIAPADGLAGVEVPPEYLFSPRNRVDWSVFVQVMRNYARLAGSAREFANMNRLIPLTEGVGNYRALCKVAISPATTYRFAAKFIPRFYTCIQPEFSVERSGIYRMKVTLQDGYEGCREFFEAAVGPLETYPTLIGLPMARVEATVTDHSGDYRIFPPSSGTLWARIKRLLQNLTGSHSALEALQEHNAELLASFEVLEQQSADLRMVLETIPDGVAILRDRQVVYSNRGLKTMLGIPTNRSLRGKPIENWLVEGDAKRLAAWIDESHRSSSPLEIRLVGQAERVTVAELSPKQVLNWHGHPATMLVFRDVTEQRLLAGSLAEASHHERQRFARDLHDGLGQHLAAVALKAKVLATALHQERPGDVEGLSDELVDLAKDASKRARDMAYAMAPVDMSAGDLISMLRQLAANTAEMFDMEYSFLAPDEPIDLPAAPATELYRAVQEALTNAHRHGNAREVSISIDRDLGRLHVAVVDNGRGFPDEHDLKPAAGMGIRIMCHRLRSIGGSCTVKARGDGKSGVRVTFDLPIPTSLRESIGGSRPTPSENKAAVASQ